MPMSLTFPLLITATRYDDTLPITNQQKIKLRFHIIVQTLTEKKPLHHNNPMIPVYLVTISV